MNPSAAMLKACVLAAIGAPGLVLALIAAPSFFRRDLPERTVGVLTQAGLTSSLLALVWALLVSAGTGWTPEVLSLGGGWVSGGAFAFDFLIDGWSLGFALLSVIICGVVSSFSFRYLHLEPGFHRYFMLLIAFVVGILLISLAGSIEVLFAGWEILGLSSVLLVAFFHERAAPVANGLRVLAFYRIGDACMLSAAVLLHHWSGSGSLASLFSGAKGVSALGAQEAGVIAALLIAAAAAKSGLFPFSTWLPRAMEGPTPSSAVYYGALSIHAGCFLLHRAFPLLERSPAARVLAAAAGAATALYAAFLAQAQTDVKSRLCFASLTQVGIIVVEIALGWRILAFLHMAGNACYRLLQFLCAPNILHDIHELENDLGGRLARAGASAPAAGDAAGTAREEEGSRAAPAGALYLCALERGFLDGIIERLVVEPLARAAARLDRFDRRLCSSLPDLLGGAGREEDSDGD